MDSLGHENLILLQLDFNLNVTWHFMFFLYLRIWNNKLKASCIIKSFLTDHYLFAPSGLVLYITDSPAPILIVFFVTCLLAGQLKSIKCKSDKNVPMPNGNEVFLTQNRKKCNLFEASKATSYICRVKYVNTKYPRPSWPSALLQTISIHTRRRRRTFIFTRVVTSSWSSVDLSLSQLILYRVGVILIT